MNKCFGEKMVPRDVLNSGLPEINLGQKKLVPLKQNKVKCNIMRCACRFFLYTLKFITNLNKVKYLSFVFFGIQVSMESNCSFMEYQSSRVRL